MITNNSKKELDEFVDKVIIGLKRANRKLVETAAKKNESLVVGDKEGNFKSVPAKELLKTLPPQNI